MEQRLNGAALQNSASTGRIERTDIEDDNGDEIESKEEEDSFEDSDEDEDDSDEKDLKLLLKESFQEINKDILEGKHMSDVEKSWSATLKSRPCICMFDSCVKDYNEDADPNWVPPAKLANSILIIDSDGQKLSQQNTNQSREENGEKYSLEPELLTPGTAGLKHSKRRSPGSKVRRMSLLIKTA